MRSFSAVLTIACVLAFSTAASADIFQYTDSEGVIHFTNTNARPGGAKLYMRADGPSRRAGVVPFMPQDRDVSRFTRYDDFIRQAATLYQIPE
ncbi:MAG: DUF4124 domain-containing protein, partial [Polyangiaceae bacterium]